MLSSSIEFPPVILGRQPVGLLSLVEGGGLNMYGRSLFNWALAPQSFSSWESLFLPITALTRSLPRSSLREVVVPDPV